MFKYTTDDKYLITTCQHLSEIPSQLDHIFAWASSNNLKLNHYKTEKIVFPEKITFKNSLPPPPFPGIERVTGINILGVIFKNDLSMEGQVDHLLSSCGSSLCALSLPAQSSRHASERTTRNFPFQGSEQVHVRVSILVVI